MPDQTVADTGQGSLAAVFFDMDGTLVDSEPFTDLLIQRLLDGHCLPPPVFPLSQFHGVTWERTAVTLAVHYPQLDADTVSARLQRDFHQCFLEEMPAFINGAKQAFLQASRVCTTGIVSSSQCATIAAVVEKSGLSGYCSVLVGAEDVAESKPDPECYLLAAQRAAARPDRCLVFEDSAAGLTAARAAGMYTVGILGCREPGDAPYLHEIAHRVIKDYRDLPDNFFSAFGNRR